jgi:hypothetical protein
MNENAEQLREVFAAHEFLAPDPSTVRAGIRSRARVYAKRRRAAQAAGGAVLGAGIVAGSVAMPGLVRSGGAHGSVQAGDVPALAGTAPTSPSPLSSQERDSDWAAYFAAGYNYDDALTLAKLWNMSGDPGTIKAEAGRRLLAGQTLPIKPSKPTAASSAADTADVNAFFDAGYTYDDAVTLSKLWKTSDAYQTKIDAGRKLLAGQPLPMAPHATPTSSPAGSASSADLDAYFAAGYTYDDAVQLAKIWNMPINDPASIKAEAGRRLLAGQTLPIQPSATPASSASATETADLNAYFSAGYTYNDAVTLSNLWKTSDTYQTKIDAGRKLLAGQTLPIAP